MTDQLSINFYIMKKTLLSLFLLASTIGASAQVTIFEDSFELYDDFAYTTGTVGSWTLVDLDLKSSYVLNGSTFPNQGTPKAFIVFNRAGILPATTSTQTQARTGEKSMACFNVSTPAPLVNNDWLISPQMRLGSSGNSVSFWVKPLNALYGLEKFNVLVSTTNTTTTSFTRVNPVTIVTPSPNAWAQHSFNLDAYAGQNVYIAIQCVSDDQFALFVDDFKVTATALSTSDFFSQNISMYPNPANGIVTLTSKNATAINSVQVTDLNGRIVKSFEANGVSETKINVSDLTAGMYFVSVKTDAGSGSMKLMKN